MMRYTGMSLKRLMSLTLCLIMILISLSACNHKSEQNVNNHKPEQSAGNNENNSEAVFEAYHEPLTAADISEEAGVYYASSQILLTAASNAPRDDVENLIKKSGAQVIGYISTTADYQIRFQDSKTLDELKQLAETLKADPLIEDAMVAYAVQYNSTAVDYKGDPWNNDEVLATKISDAVGYNEDNIKADTSGSHWTDRPLGSNWWAESIDMPKVWEMDLKTETVKVGVVDTMFDVDNDDLDDGLFVKTWNNPTNEDGSCKVTQMYKEAVTAFEQAKINNDQAAKEAADAEVRTIYHGTHVAGIIGADGGNGYGITGINQNVELYGYALSTDETAASDESRWTTAFLFKYYLAQLLNADVKVINISMGVDDALKGAQDGDPHWTEYTAVNSKALETFLLKYIDAGKDFLIVKSAGNDSKQKTDTTEEKKYYAEYDLFGAIRNPKVANRILIVGAAKHNAAFDYHTITHFSNVGDRVDVYAPGWDVLSVVPSDSALLKPGTSQAAPIVSGLASLAWGINPDLTAEQVRSFIIASQSATILDLDDAPAWMHGMDDFTPIVNAAIVAQLAQATVGEDGKETKSAFGTVNGVVYAASADASNFADIDIDSLTLCDENGNVISDVALQDEAGRIVDKQTNQASVFKTKTYSLLVEPGTYILKAKPKGYKPQERTITVEPNAVLLENFKFINLDSLVTDAYKNTSVDNDIAIPKINLSSGDCKKINEAIWTEYYAKRVPNLSPYDGMLISYEWSVTDDILSLVIESGNTQTYLKYYDAYTVDIATEKQLSADEVITVAGLSSSEYQKRAKEALGSLYHQVNDQYDENFYNQSFVDMYNHQLKRTLANENLNNTIPFFNKDGQLCMTAKMYALAGATYYEYIVNLEDYQVVPDYDKEVVVKTNGKTDTADDDRGIVGSWGQKGSVVFDYEFTENGVCYWNGLKNQPGTYKISSDNVLTITFPWTTDRYVWSDESFDEFRKHSDEYFWYLDGDILKLNGREYFRDGIVQIETNKTGALIGILEGKWLNKFESKEYVFYADGTYEINHVVIANNTVIYLDQLLKGSIDVQSETEARLWQDITGLGQIPSYSTLIYDPDSDTFSFGGNNDTHKRSPY